MLPRLLSKFFSSHKKTRDDFIARIRVAVPGEGMLDDGNLRAFDHAVRHLPPQGAVLEIGSWGGLSTNIIAYLLRKYGLRERPFFTCDPWIYEGFQDTKRGDDSAYMNHVDGSDTLLRTDYMELVREAFMRNAHFFSGENLPHSFRLRSDDFFKIWEMAAPQTDIFGRSAPLGGPLAFAYVDGDHAYQTAWADAQNVLEYLVPGGFLLLDDSAEHLPYGSVQVARSLCRDKRLRLVGRWPNHFFQKK